MLLCSHLVDCLIPVDYGGTDPQRHIWPSRGNKTNAYDNTCFLRSSPDVKERKSATLMPSDLVYDLSTPNIYFTYRTAVCVHNNLNNYDYL